jgi:hypothetical protein
VSTNELVPGSCSFNAKNGVRFKHSDGKWYAYSKFDKVLPNWSQSVEKKPLLLREHIFYNYQYDLASFFSRKKCTELPLSYNYPMSEIKEDTSRLLSQKAASRFGAPGRRSYILYVPPFACSLSWKTMLPVL